MIDRVSNRFGLVVLAAVLWVCSGSWAYGTVASPKAAPDSPGAGAAGAVSDFQATGEYVLEVDGKDVKADIYHSDRSAAFLVVSPALPTPVVLQPRTQELESAAAAKITKLQDGTMVLQPDYRIGAASKFNVAGEDVLFEVGGKHAKIKERPFLLGLQSVATVRGYKPEYERNLRAYRPDPAIVQALKMLQTPVRVRVFFGSWCPHCTEHMPSIMRLEEELKGSHIAFDYYGLPRGAAMRDEPEAKRVGVDAVPTAIVYVGMREIGRITGEGWRRPEAALKDVLSAAADSK